MRDTLDLPYMRNLCDGGFFYLASPYSLYYSGLDAAFCEACQIAAWFMQQGVVVFTPIVHSHSIAMYGSLNPRDHDIWNRANLPLMSASKGCIVAMMPGWRESVGIRWEVDEFESQDKPVFYAEWPRKD